MQIQLIKQKVRKNITIIIKNNVRKDANSSEMQQQHSTLCLLKVQQKQHSYKLNFFTKQIVFNKKNLYNAAAYIQK